MNPYYNKLIVSIIADVYYNQVKGYSWKYTIQYRGNTPNNEETQTVVI
jgi:hypothetical protein